MIRYLLTRKGMDGEVVLEYDTRGLLMKWHIKANLDSTQWEWLIQRIPCEEKDIEAYRKRGFEIKKELPDLSFERFYKEYGLLLDKKRAQAIWDRLPAAYKMKAIECIPAYDRYCARTGVAKKYPKTFLAQESFLNDFKTP